MEEIRFNLHDFSDPLHISTQCGSSTHQFQAERASVGRGIVHCTVALFVSHSGISVVPQQVLHTPDKDKRGKVCS